MWKFVALYLAATMAVPYAVVSFPAVADAQAQPVMDTVSVAVLPIRDTANAYETVESQKATDALYLAMEATRQFVVTSRADLRREMDHLELAQPLSIPQQVRLGDRLAVDAVLSGELTKLEVNERTGAVRVSMSVALLEIITGEFVNGGDVDITTNAIPGWHGEHTRVINNALREVTEKVVEVMITSWVPEGTVTSVNEFGVATVNLGRDHGVVPGMEMLIVRPVWQRTLEEIVMVKQGRFSITEVGARLSKMSPIDDAGARAGDRVHRLYRGPERMQAIRHRASHQQTLTTVMALAALFGVVYVASEASTIDAPRAVTSNLWQRSPGDEAVIRVNVPDVRNVPMREQIYAWLFFRGEGHQNFGLDVERLVGVEATRTLPGDAWDDRPGFEFNIELEREWTYLTGDGDEEEVSLSVVYHHWSLEPGRTYFHRVQRVVEPMRRAGAGAPIAISSVGPSQLPEDIDDAEFEVDPWEALTEGSSPTDGVTYFSPPTLQTPEDGAPNQHVTEITFTWSATVGANEYILQVFPEDDPDGVRVPRYQVEMRQDRPGTMSHTIHDRFDANARFYWRVGARRAGERAPVNERLRSTPHGEGWLFSSIRTFRTADAPPPVPSSAVRGSDGAPAYPGSMGIHRYRHPEHGNNSSGIR